jgi:hypothetical protein
VGVYECVGTGAAETGCAFGSGGGLLALCVSFFVTTCFVSDVSCRVFAFDL